MYQNIICGMVLFAVSLWGSLRYTNSAQNSPRSNISWILVSPLFSPLSIHHLIWNTTPSIWMILLLLQWRPNERVDVSNHQRLHCLLNHSFGRRSKKTSKLRVTGLCAGNSPVNSPHKRPVTRKMFPFDYVIMVCCQNDWTTETEYVMYHYADVIMSAMASQITGVSNDCSTVCSGADRRTHQSSASLAFVQGIRRWPVNSPHKGPVTRKMLPFDDVIMYEWGFASSEWCNDPSSY